MYSNRIFIIRENNDLNQEQMSKKLHTSQSNYSRWENNKEFIPLESLNELCNLFKTNMDYVMNFTKSTQYNGNKRFNKIIIGKNLQTLRKKYNLTQEQLALFLNTTQSTISSYEAGKTTLLTSFAIQIVKKYNISLEWLCGRCDK